MKIVWGRSIGFNLELNKNMEYTIITDGADCYPWTEFFVLWPRTTITGKRIFWEKAFKRRVWVVWGTGFHMEPEVEYATLFEIIGDDYNEN
jgi:hypothetical protein